MGKLKEFVQRQRTEYLEILKKYKITIILVIAACLYHVVFEEILQTPFEKAVRTVMGADDYHALSEFSTRIYVFLMMSAVGSFFTETMLQSKKTEKKAYLLSFVGGVIWVLLEMAADHTENEYLRYYIGMSAVLYVLVLAGVSMMRIIKESGLRFEQYAVRLLFTTIKVGAVLLTLNIGLILLLQLFDTLITDIPVWDFMENVEVLLVGFVYVPYGLICITGKTEEKSKFVRGLLLFCMMPIILAATAIVYLYIAKILITQDFPSNEVFYICALLFSFGVCIWTFCYAYTRDEKSNLYYQVIKYMKYIYAPFLLLEIYCIGVRIGDYGFTSERYLAVWFIIAQVIYTAWEPLVNLCRRLFMFKTSKPMKVGYGEHYEWLIYVGIGIFVMLAFVPLTQVDRVVFRSQKARFLASYGESEEALKNANGAYRELRGNMYGEPWLKANYDTEALAEAMSGVGSPSYRDRIYVSQGNPEYSDGISIAGYETMYSMHVYRYSYDDPLTKKDYSAFKISYGNGKESVTVDLAELIGKSVKAYEKGGDKIGDFPYMVDVDGVRVMIFSIDFTYNRDTEELERLELDGVILK